MLRSAGRLSKRLPPCTCRFASTAAATATASTSGSPSYLSSLPLRDRPLFSTTVLPPLPPPLPSDSDPDSWSIRPNIVSPHNSPEQLAILSACLAQGDILRAEEVIARITSSWTSKFGERPAANLQSSLAAVLPPKLHAEFLRAYFAQAILAHQSAARSAGSAALKNKRDGLLDKIWAYLNQLVSSSLWQVGTGKRRYTASVDASVLAVALKGIVALAEPLRSSDDLLRSIRVLLARSRSLQIGLYDILHDPVFDVNLPSSLGAVTRLNALDLLTEELQSHDRGAIWDDWNAEVVATRKRVEADEHGAELVMQKLKYVELDPTRRKDDVAAPLKTLQTNLSTLQLPDQPFSPTARQILLEESSYDAARQLYIHEMEELAKVGKSKDRSLQGDWLQRNMFAWLTALTDELVAQSKQHGRGSVWSREAEIEPFMRVLEPDQMALITIVELLRLSGGGGVSDGMKATRAVLHIGKAIENAYHAKQLRESKSEKEFWRQMEQLAQATTLSETGETAPQNKERDLQRLWRQEFKAREASDDPWQPAWTQQQRAKVGSLLVSALVETAKVEMTANVDGKMITELHPAFAHSYQFLRGNKIGVIKVNPAVAQHMDQDPLRITLHPRFLPMLVTPKPWMKFNNGAYLRHHTLVMRCKDSEEQIDYLRQADQAETLENIYAGLDVLGGVPWKINRPVFDVISAVWNTGESFADIPAKDQLSKPLDVEKPEGIETDLRAKDSFRHRLRKALQERRSLHSNRCDLNYKLEIARAFLDETFYFPHNLDFRGRAYPIPPNLSHIGDDLCRGILTFGEAKPLGDRGLRWLKIHLANVRGFDKASFDDREAYAMEHLDDIYDSADRPLEGGRWWLQADDPWQCLATCFELAAALRSPNPAEFLSSLPIHQDGTCNGLQHYAALGGDIKGASQVNLEGGDRPSDVYTGVADMANEVVNRDAAKGHKYALLLKGKVTRKVVKQTVMTTVYGVTFVGAKKQIEKQLKDRGDLPAEELYGAALYLGRIVLDSIGDVFKGATAIQTWLHKSARLIARSIPPSRIAAAKEADTPKRGKKAKIDLSRIPKELMTSVVWTTPLGLPVVQPYRKARKRQVPTILQSVSISDPSVPSEVDPRAQATAFPPNFIHSLDATHMMMTALECKDKIAFASVHDSYWTHACSVDEMSIILRDCFVKLHSSDVLGSLRQDFLRRYKGHVIPVSTLPTKSRKSKTKAAKVEDVIAVETAADIEHETPEGVDDGSAEYFGSSTAVDAPLFSKNKKAMPEDEGVPLEEWIFGPGSKGNLTKTGTPLVPLADHLPPLPERGSFDLNRVKESLYFFS